MTSIAEISLSTASAVLVRTILLNRLSDDDITCKDIVYFFPRKFTDTINQGNIVPLNMFELYAEFYPNQISESQELR